MSVTAVLVYLASVLFTGIGVVGFLYYKEIDRQTAIVCLLIGLVVAASLIIARLLWNTTLPGLGGIT